MSDQQTSLIQASAILISQFQFYGPRYGDSFVQFSFFLSHLFFPIHISFVKCKYCSLVFFLFFVDFRPLMKPKGESVEVAN